MAATEDPQQGSSAYPDARLRSWIDQGEHNQNIVATEHQHDGIATTIYQACVDLYRGIWNAYRIHRTKSDPHRIQIRDNLSQFVLWGESIKDGKFDTVLESSNDLRDCVLEVLSHITKTLIKGASELGPILASPINHDVESPLGQAKTILEKTKTMCGEDASWTDSDSDTGSDDSNSQRILFRADRRFVEDMATQLTCLMDLLPTIEHAIEQRDLSGWVSVSKASSVSSQIRAPTEQGVRQIRDKSSGASIGRAKGLRTSLTSLEKQSNHINSEQRRGDQKGQAHTRMYEMVSQLAESGKTSTTEELEVVANKAGDLQDENPHLRANPGLGLGWQSQELSTKHPGGHMEDTALPSLPRDVELDHDLGFDWDLEAEEFRPWDLRKESSFEIEDKFFHSSPTRGTLGRRKSNITAMKGSKYPQIRRPVRCKKSEPKTMTEAERRVFVCTFHHYGCEAVFTLKKEWKRHVSSQHMSLGFYRCQTCNCKVGSGNKGPKDFNRKDLFTQHYRRMHTPWGSGKLPDTKAQQDFENSLKRVQEQCWNDERAPPQKTTCGFCRQIFVGNSAWDERMEHVGKHYEAIAKGTFKAEDMQEEEDEHLRQWALQEGIIEDHGQSGCWLVGLESKSASLPRRRRAQKPIESVWRRGSDFMPEEIKNEST